MPKRSSAAKVEPANIDTIGVATVAKRGQQGKAADAGWRGSREVWLQAAYESLLASGVDSVRIQPLGKMINLSRTSFYWFFENREELLSDLIRSWREKNTDGMIVQTRKYSETLQEAILNVFDCWLDLRLFDAPFEHAMRSWALQSDDVAREIATADKMRIDALADVFMRYGTDEISADVRARAIYLTQIGYISMQVKEDPEVRFSRISKYVEIFTGVPPKPHELARFFARHHYTPAETVKPSPRRAGR